MDISDLRKVDSLRAWVLSIGCVLAFGALFGGCKPESSSASAEQGEVRIHPTAENIPDRDQLSDLIPKQRRTEISSDLAAASERLRQAVVAASIGVEEGGRTEMIGQVADVKVSGDTVLVLDERYNELRMYDRAGTHIQTLGRAGQGPDEFRHPRRLVVGGGGDVTILGRPNQLKRFEVGAGTLTRRATATRPHDIDDICALGTDVIARGVDSDKNPIHRISPSSFGASAEAEKETVAFSFGRAYQDPSPFIWNQLSGGPVACLSEESVIVTAPSRFSVIYGYRANGDSLWTSQIEAFQPMKIVSQGAEGERQSLGYEIEGSHANEIISLVDVSERFVLAQVGRQTVEAAENGRRFSSLHSYLLDGRTGRGTYVTDQLPVVRATNEEGFVAYETEPFPRVLLYEYVDGKDMP